MFKIEENNIFYRFNEDSDWMHYGKVIVADHTEEKNVMEIKKFNLQTEVHEHCDELQEYLVGGKIYPVVNGFFTVDPVEKIEEPAKELTQLDRIESLLLEEKSAIAEAAIDNYTLELIESGAL